MICSLSNSRFLSLCSTFSSDFEDEISEASDKENIGTTTKGMDSIKRTDSTKLKGRRTDSVKRMGSSESLEMQLDDLKARKSFNKDICEITNPALMLLRGSASVDDLTKALTQLKRNIEWDNLSMEDALYVSAVIAAVDYLLPPGSGLSDPRRGALFSIPDIKKLCDKAGIGYMSAKKKQQYVDVLKQEYPKRIKHLKSTDTINQSKG